MGQNALSYIGPTIWSKTQRKVSANKQFQYVRTQFKETLSKET